MKNVQQPISDVVTEEVIGRFAALQAGAEVTIGAVLHSLSFPFTGHILSLNQAILHHFAAKKSNLRQQKVRIIIGSGIVCALLKGLSPVGKRLTPMFAILVQSLLFGFGIGIFGHNLIGLMIGISLLSLWGFLQPLLLAYIFFGKSLFLALYELIGEINTYFHLDPRFAMGIFSSFIIIKVIISIGSALYLIKQGISSEEYIDSISNFEKALRKKIKMSDLSPQKNHLALNWQNKVTYVLKDLMQPIYLLGLILSVTFIYISTHPSWVLVTFYVLRVLAVSFFVFYFIRFFKFEKLNALFKKVPGLQIAFQNLKKQN